MSQLATISGKVCLSPWRSDGDTFPFKPDNPADFYGLPVKPRLGVANEWVRVRMDGIDAPEIHYRELSQSTSLGRAATEYWYGFLSNTVVAWSIAGNNPTNVEEVDARLHIVGVDLLGRCIGVLFAPSGDTFPEDSVNWEMVQGGYAYPAVFETTPASMRTPIYDAWAYARANALGVAGIDATKIFSLPDAVEDQAVFCIHPKIWRRCALYASIYPDMSSWELFLKRRNDLYITPTRGVQNLRKNMPRTGDDIEVNEDIFLSVWQPKGLIQTSQIQKLLAIIAV